MLTDLTIKNIGRYTSILNLSSDTISFFPFPILLFFLSITTFPPHPSSLSFPFAPSSSFDKHLHNLLYSLDSVGGESALDDFRCSSIDRSYCTFNGQTHTEYPHRWLSVKRDRQMEKGGGGREIRGLDIVVEWIGAVLSHVFQTDV